VLQRNDLFFFSAPGIAKMLNRKLQRHFPRRRSIVGEKKVCLILRHPLPQARRQLFGRLMRKPCQDHMLHLSCLFADRGRDPRIRVPVDVYPPRRHRINYFPAVFRIQQRAFGALNFNRRRIKR